MDDADLNHIFHALADPTRRAILLRIRGEEFSVTELAEPFGMSLPAISKHLKVLEQAGLIRRTKAGRIHWCGFARNSAAEAETYLRELLSAADQ